MSPAAALPNPRPLLCSGAFVQWRAVWKVVAQEKKKSCGSNLKWLKKVVVQV